VADRLITARVVNYEEPDWRPLERFASPYLAGSFMWMHEVRTRRGESFHAYKHIETRCYVHLGIDGNGLAFHWDEKRYGRYPAWVLLKAALRPWWEELNASAEEIALAQMAIQRARELDWGSQLIDVPDRRADLALALDRALLDAADRAEGYAP